MTAVGRFRVYFNRHQAAPLVWCVALVREGEMAWEMAVAGVELRAPSSTVYAARAEADEDSGLPSAYIETAGRLTVCDSGNCALAFIEDA